MDMFGAPFVNHEYLSFDPALLSPELSGNVPAYFDPSGAGSYPDNSDPSTSHARLSIAAQERYSMATFDTHSQEFVDFWASHCDESGAFPQPGQMCYESVEGTVFQTSLTPADISHTASHFEAWSPIGASASYSSEASPPALQDVTGRDNFSMIEPGFPVQTDHHLDGESEPTPLQPPNAKKKRAHGPVVCPLCSKLFDKPYLLRAHMLEHGDRYSCPRCQQTFAQAGNLAMHMKKHEGPPYECQTCARVFVKAMCYRNHIKCHNENREKKKCPKEGCDKAYTFSGCLNRHIRSHYEDYVCSDCGKFYKRSDLRDRHQAKHCVTARERRLAEHSLVSGSPYARLQPSPADHQADEPVQLQALAQHSIMH